MKICLIGQNLTNLILANVFEEKVKKIIQKTSSNEKPSPTPLWRGFLVHFGSILGSPALHFLIFLCFLAFRKSLKFKPRKRSREPYSKLALWSLKGRLTEASPGPQTCRSATWGWQTAGCLGNHSTSCLAARWRIYTYIHVYFRAIGYGFVYL